MREKELYISQLKALEDAGFVLDRYQDERPGCEITTYSKEENISGVEYVCIAHLDKSGRAKVCMSPQSVYDESGIDGVKAIRLDNPAAIAVRNQLRQLESDVKDSLERLIPFGKVDITVSPPQYVGLKGIMVDCIGPIDRVYYQLRQYLENKGR